MNVLGLDVAARDKGFALKLRAIAFDDTMQVKYNRKDIAAIMEVSQPTLRKKMKAIEVMYKDGFVAEYFPVCEKCYLSKENVELIKEWLMDNDQTSRVYKQLKWFLQNKLHLRRDADDRLLEIFAGIMGKKKVVRKVEKAVFDW